MRQNQIQNKIRDLYQLDKKIDQNWNLVKKELSKNDVKEGDELTRSVQTKLEVVYDYHDFSKEELLNWLQTRTQKRILSRRQEKIF